LDVNREPSQTVELTILLGLQLTKVLSPLLEQSTLTIIALGSNLGDSTSILNEAIEELQSFSSQPILRSSLWKTEPVDCPPKSPSFVNAVLGLIPFESESPESLLSKLQLLEKTFGRKAKIILNEARPLDLDIISFGQELRNSPALTLPHPRAHLRRFVLAPLAEIAPDYRLPGQQQSVSQLLQAPAQDQMIARLIY
jgi:2-amino-4-hydroxy-6-hydroxymethyldihydropteridine diphosphokinase